LDNVYTLYSFAFYCINLDIFYIAINLSKINNSKNIHVVKVMLDFLIDILIIRNYKYYLISNL